MFIGHLAGDLCLDSHIYVSFDDEEISSSELAVALPLLSESLDHMISLEYFFEKQLQIGPRMGLDYSILRFKI